MQKSRNGSLCGLSFCLLLQPRHIEIFIYICIVGFLNISPAIIVSMGTLLHSVLLLFEPGIHRELQDRLQSYRETLFQKKSDSNKVSDGFDNICLPWEKFAVEPYEETKLKHGAFNFKQLKIIFLRSEQVLNNLPKYCHLCVLDNQQLTFMCSFK